MLERRTAISALRTHLSRLGLDRRYQKVFAIGFNKTATTSINTIFEDAGLNARHETDWRDTSKLGVHRRYDAFSDGPPKNFAVLDAKFPRSLFILNTRDLAEWIDSRLEHIRFEEETGIAHYPGDWMRTDEAVCSWIRRRNAYHLGVMTYFENRPEDILVVNFIRDTDAAAKIRTFLGQPADPSKPYTKSTPKTRKQGALKNHDMIQRCFEKLGVPENERSKDLYCRSLVDDSGLLRFPDDTSELP